MKYLYRLFAVAISAAFFVGPAQAQNSGALPPGVDQNTLSTKTANYTIANTDCGKTIQAGTGSTGQFTITLPAVTGFPATCSVIVLNGDTGRGKKLSGFPTTMVSSSILWPSQSVTVKIVNGAWAVTKDPGRWVKNNATFYVDTAGSDANDGLATGASAFLTLNKCVAVAELYIDTASGGNGGVTCSPTAGQSFQGLVQVFFGLTGGGTIIFQGNGGAFIWKPANSGYALQFGDLGVVGLTDVTFSSAGTTTPAGFIYGHNAGILDVNTGVSFTPTVAVTGSAFTCDYDSHFNINNGLTINAGTITNRFYDGCAGSTWNINGTETHSGTPTIGKWMTVVQGMTAAIQGNVTFSGSITASSATTVDAGGMLANYAGTLPGGSVVVSNLGQVCTTVGPPASCTTGMDAGNLTGTIAAGRMPAHTGDCTSSAGSVALTCNKTNGNATKQVSINISGVNFNSAGDTTITVPAGPNSAYSLGAGVVYNCTAFITTATFEIRTASGGGGTALTATTTGTNTSQGPTTAASVQQFNNSFTGWLNASQLFFRIVTPQGSAVTCSLSIQINYL